MKYDLNKSNAIQLVDIVKPIILVDIYYCSIYSNIQIYKYLYYNLSNVPLDQELILVTLKMKINSRRSPRSSSRFYIINFPLLRRENISQAFFMRNFDTYF